MLSDADEAEDAVQHTFMAAYRELEGSDKPIHLRAWLYTVARNRCYSIIRARREQPSDSLDEAATEGLAAEVQRRQDLRDLVADVRRLPEEQRAALVLAELDALSHEDIASVLGVPRDKVKALVYQARESLVASRTARDTACSEIREQLASGRGAVLRRSNLRRHLRECDGCREFRAQVETQRKQFAVLLPVLPAAALKEGLFGGAGVVIGGTAAVGGGAVAATALKTGVAKGVLGAVLASVGTASTLVMTGSGMQVKSLAGSIERVVPKSVPTSRLIGRRVPRAKPDQVSSTHATAIPSFRPTEVAKPVAVSRPAPVAARRPHRSVLVRLAAPVRVPQVRVRPHASRPPVSASPVRVPAPPPTARAIRVPPATRVTQHAAAPATPATAPATPPGATTPAPTPAPPVAVPPAPSSPAPSAAPTSPPAAVAQVAPAMPSVHVSQGPSAAAAAAHATSASGKGNGNGKWNGNGNGNGNGYGNENGNGNGNAWGHQHGSTSNVGAAPPGITAHSVTGSPTQTATTATTPATTTPSTIPAPTTQTSTTPVSTTPVSSAPSSSPTTTGPAQAGAPQPAGADSSVPSSGAGNADAQGGSPAEASAAPASASPYSH